MKQPSRSIENLFDSARNTPPVLSEAETTELLELVDRRRSKRVLVVLGHFLATFFDGYVGIASAAIGFAVGVATTVLYVDEAQSPTLSDAGYGSRITSMGTVPNETTVDPQLPDATRTEPPHAVRQVASEPSAISSHVLSPIVVDIQPSTEPPTAAVADDNRPLVADITAASSVGAHVVEGEQGVRGLTIGMRPMGIPTDRDAHPLWMPREMNEQGDFTVYAESGSSYTTMLGGFRNSILASDITAPQNFATSKGGWGLHAAAGIAMPLASWIRATAGVRVTQGLATYTSPDVVFAASPGATHLAVAIPVEHSVSLSLGEISFEPSLRVQAPTVPVFLDAGISIGFLYRQSATYSTAITQMPSDAQVAVPAMSAPQQFNTIGAARTQYDLRVGIGTSVPLSNGLTIEAQVRGEYGLVPLFADNYSRRMSITPAVGISMLMPR